MALIEEVFETQRQILAKLAGLEQRLATLEREWQRFDESVARMNRELERQQARRWAEDAAKLRR